MSGISETPAPAWQPIKTAPRVNENHVLAWIQYTPEEADMAGVQGRREVARWSDHCGGWLLDHDACNEHHSITHWMPLLAPPVSP